MDNNDTLINNTLDRISKYKNQKQELTTIQKLESNLELLLKRVESLESKYVYETFYFNKFQNKINENINILKQINKKQQDIFFLAIQVHISLENQDEVRKCFFSSLNPNKKELLDIHEGSSTLLRIFDEICRKNDINYFITAGSMLGAIRGRNPIPWDDDLDIGIMKNDFYKLFKIINSDLYPEIYLQNTIISSERGLKAFVHRLYFKPNVSNHVEDLIRSPFLDIFTYFYTDNILPQTFEDVIDFKIEISKQLDLIYKKELRYIKKSSILNERVMEILNDIDGLFYRRFPLFGEPNKNGGVILWGRNIYDTKQIKKLSFSYDEVFPLRDVPYGDFNAKTINKAEYFLNKRYGDIFYMPNDLLKPKHGIIKNYRQWIDNQKIAIKEIKSKRGW